MNAHTVISQPGQQLQGEGRLSGQQYVLIIQMNQGLARHCEQIIQPGWGHGLDWRNRQTAKTSQDERKMSEEHVETHHAV
jgi:hypothetical protein